MIYQHFYGKSLEKNRDTYETIMKSSILEDYIVNNLIEHYSEYPLDNNYLDAHGKKMKYPDVHTFFCTENNMCIRAKIAYETKNDTYFSHSYIFDGKDFSEILSDKNKVFNIKSYVKKYKKLNQVHFKKGLYSYEYKNTPISSYESIKFYIYKIMFGISGNTIKNFVYAAFKAAKENEKIFITLGKENSNLSIYALNFLENAFDAIPMEIKKYCGFITYSQKIIDKKYINLVFLPKETFDSNFNNIKDHYYFDYIKRESNIEYKNGKSEYIEYIFSNLKNNEKIQDFKNTIDRVISQFDESFKKDIDTYDDLTLLYKIDNDNNLSNIDTDTAFKKCFQYLTANYVHNNVWFKQIFETIFEIEYKEKLSKGAIPSKEMITMMLEYYSIIDEPLQKKIIEYLLVILKNSIDNGKKDIFIEMINYIFEYDESIFSKLLKVSINNEVLSLVYKNYVSYRLETMDKYKAIEDDIRFWLEHCIMTISTQYYYIQVKEKIFYLLSNEIDLVYRQNYIYSIFDNFLRENLDNIYNHDIIYKLANKLKEDICNLLIEKIDIEVLSEDDLRHFILTYGTASEKKDILNLVKNILIYNSKETINRLHNRLSQIKGQQIDTYKDLIRNLYVNHINEGRFEEVIMGFVKEDTFEYFDMLEYILNNAGSVSTINFIKWSQNYKPFIDSIGKIKREYLIAIKKYFIELDSDIFSISRMKDEISNFESKEIQDVIESANKKINNNLVSKGINFLKKSFNMANNESPPYEIVCPYCFEKFNHMEVLFRCAHSKEDDENYALKEDSLLNAYRNKLNLNPVDKMEAILYPEKTPLRNLKFNEKVLSQLIDKYGIEAKKRLCPCCHSELPNISGKIKGITISVIGATECGKSVYIASLINTLRNITATNFDASFIPISNEVSDRYKENYESCIFDKNLLPKATEKDTIIEPLIFQFRSKDDKKPPISISFYDVSGEGMKDIRYIETFAASIKNSDAIMFLVDPLQMNSIKDKISMNIQDTNCIDDSLQQQGRDVLIGLAEDFISDTQNQKTTIPTAIVVTKSDLLKHLQDDEYINKDSKIFEDYHHKNAFDIMEFNELTAEVKAFISKADSTFKDAVDVYFENAAYFAVSSLGHNPSNGEIKEDILNLRVDEPFLWILHQLNYIDGRYTN